jgi:hypothetical protein
MDMSAGRWKGIQMILKMLTLTNAYWEPPHRFTELRLAARRFARSGLTLPRGSCHCPPFHVQPAETPFFGRQRCGHNLLPDRNLRRQAATPLAGGRTKRPSAPEKVVRAAGSARKLRADARRARIFDEE